MKANRQWMVRNLGFDPLKTPPPATTFAFAKAASTGAPEDLQREIIDFDSESTSGLRFLAFTTATACRAMSTCHGPRGWHQRPPRSHPEAVPDPFPAPTSW